MRVTPDSSGAHCSVYPTAPPLSHHLEPRTQHSHTGLHARAAIGTVVRAHARTHVHTPTPTRTHTHPTPRITPLVHVTSGRASVHASISPAADWHHALCAPSPHNLARSQLMGAAAVVFAVSRSQLATTGAALTMVTRLGSARFATSSLSHATEHATESEVKKWSRSDLPSSE